MPVCLRFPVHAGSVGSSTEESGKVGYQIKHFPLDDQITKCVHDLLDRGGPIPPVHVQFIDIRRPQFLEGCLDGDVEGLCVIPGVIHLVGVFILSVSEMVGRNGRTDRLVADICV
jgi:hypothetical protein